MKLTGMIVLEKIALRTEETALLLKMFVDEYLCSKAFFMPDVIP